MRYELNMASINAKVASSSKVQQKSDEIVEKKLKIAKEIVLNEFDSHPVTKEIEGGASADNKSNTLDGYGNLFSFIGFEAGADPISSIREFLKNSFKVKKEKATKSLKKTYFVHSPSLEDFNFAIMPWENKSWVKEIESGISGFNYYLSKMVEASRSGTAIQIDNKLRSIGSSKASDYMSEILQNFKKRMQS